MNGIAMISQQMKMPGNVSNGNANKAQGELSVFQGLMMKKQASMSMDVQTDSDGKVEQMNIEELLDLIQKVPGLSDLLKELGITSNDLMKLVSGANSLEEALTKLEGFLDTYVNQQQDNKTDQSVDQVFMNFQAAPIVLGQKSIQPQFVKIAKQVKQIMEKLTDGGNLSKAASSLVKLLEQWTALEKKTGNDKNAANSFVSPKDFGGPKEQAIWRDLLQSFQKRNQFVNSQQYNTNAKVTSSDVVKWLQKALNDQTQLDKMMPQQTVSISSMPMSKVEQFVIYMNQNQGSQSVDQQLIDQFQKVMKTSKFLSMNGTSQLSITLKPVNLGEMLVKMTQVNGEMIVKILVSSQATKDMLESNIHQLKHMFSPQQVVIEKQDLSSGQAQSFQNERDDQSMNGNQHGHSDNHSGDNDANKQSTDESEMQFHEILMNEKV